MPPLYCLQHYVVNVSPIQTHPLPFGIAGHSQDFSNPLPLQCAVKVKEQMWTIVNLRHSFMSISSNVWYFRDPTSTAWLTQYYTGCQMASQHRLSCWDAQDQNFPFPLIWLHHPLRIFDHKTKQNNEQILPSFCIPLSGESLHEHY